MWVHGVSVIGVPRKSYTRDDEAAICCNKLEAGLVLQRTLADRNFLAFDEFGVSH